MTRPVFPKFTPETVLRILRAARLGAPVHVVAMSGGISVDTLNRWLHDGEQGHPMFARFFSDYSLARSEGLLEALEAVESAYRSGVWQAGAWKAERLFPETFGKNAGQLAPSRGPIQIEYVNDWRGNISSVPGASTVEVPLLSSGKSE